MTLKYLSLPFLSIVLSVSAHGALAVVAQNLPLEMGDTHLFGVVVGASQPSDGELYDWRWGQTFLAQASGQLYTIEATVDTSAGYVPVHPLMVSLVSLVEGQRGEVLASTLVSSSDIPGGSLAYAASGFSITAQFSEGVLLQEGTQYAIEFSIPTRPAHFVVWGNSTMEDAVSDYYPEGAFYQPDSGEPIDSNRHGDFYFRVTVQVPEASSVQMGGLGVFLMRRRRTR